MGLEFPPQHHHEYTGFLALTCSAAPFHLKLSDLAFPRWQIHGVESLERFPECWNSPEESGPGALLRCWTPERVSINSLWTKPLPGDAGPQALASQFKLLSFKQLKLMFLEN